MALYCLCSAGGSPGVTTTALGLALAWPQRVLLAECDPMGRRVLPGFMADRLREPAGPGLLGLATVAMASSDDALPLEKYVLPMLDDGNAELLHGLKDPRHAYHLTELWAPLAAALAARDGDVLADLGRVGGPQTPVPLLRAADAVIMLLKPSLVQVDAATPRLDALRELVGERTTIGMCLIADGPYSASEVERVLKVPVLGELPNSPGDARVFSDGAPPRRTFRTSLLARSLQRLGRRMRKAAGKPGAQLNDQVGTTRVAALTTAGGHP
jgi:hypothetical protein